MLGRGHSAGDVKAAVSRARAAGFANVSLDLIFGVPGQTAESWRDSLAHALALEPAHVSTYGLTVEEGTPFAAWQAREPGAFASGDLEAELYALAIDTLEGAGFEQYEISNFARPGFRCAHNENYWANGEYLGLGVGAASFLGGVRSTHTRELASYVASAARRRRDSRGERAPRRPGARRRGRHARAAHAPGGRCCGLCGTVWSRCARFLRTRAFRDDRAGNARGRIFCGSA